MKKRKGEIFVKEERGKELRSLFVLYKILVAVS
jgi:hypothetical protein